MVNIQVLDQITIDKIAAGEVIALQTMDAVFQKEKFRLRFCVILPAKSAL